MSSKVRQKQVARVLEYVERFGSITTLEARDELGILSLSRRICDIKELGYQVTKKRDAVKNRDGDYVSIVRYSIKKEVA